MDNNKHTVSLAARNLLSVTAVDDVLSFDEELISLSVGESVLNVSGESLSLKNLSLDIGEVTVEGRVDALVYTEPSSRKKRFSLFGRGNG